MMPLSTTPPYMKSLIQVYSRSVYGKATIYMIDGKQAMAIRMLTQCKTLEQRHISALTMLGFTFETVADPGSVPSWLTPSNVAALKGE